MRGDVASAAADRRPVRRGGPEVLARLCLGGSAADGMTLLRSSPMPRSFAPILMAVAALAAGSAEAASSDAPRQVLPFIADDYPQARAAARARSLPIFVEAWAPW